MKRTRISVFTSLLLSFALVTSLNAQQKKDIRFEHLTTENGLSSNQITLIIKDQKGFVWIGTADAGLNRFDGIHVKTYKADTLNENALRSDFISCLIEAKDGKLWVGQFDQGICLFDPLTEKFKRYKHDDKDPKSLSKGFINSVYEDREGRIWITSYGGGLNLYDKKNDNFIHYAHDKDSPPGSISTNSLRDIKQDKNGLFWIASFGKDNDGVSCIQNFDANTGKFQRLDFTSYIDDEGKEIKIPPRGTDIVNRIFINSDENIWFASYIGAMKYDVKSKKLQVFYGKENKKDYLTSTNIKAICQDNSGDIWMATQNGGLLKYNEKNNKFDAYQYNFNNTNSISENSIRSIYKDDEGRFWVSTFTGGVNIINPIKQEFSLIQNEELNAKYYDKAAGNVIRRITVDSKDRLIAGSGSGISVFDLKTHKLLFIKSPEVGKIIDLNGKTEFGERNNQSQLIEIAEGKILVNSNNISSSIFDLESKQFSKWVTIDTYSKHRSFCYKDADNVFYTSVGYKLSFANNEISSEKIRKGEMTNDTYCVNTSIDGKIFIGTNEEGLIVYDKKTNTQKNYTNDSTKGCINNKSVTTIIKDKNNTIWVGTISGLNKFDLKNETFTFIDQPDGIANNPILCAELDTNGNIWFVTPSEIVKFSPTTNVYIHFNKELGLNTANLIGTVLCKSKNGTFYVTSQDGVISFNPYKLSESRNAPKLYITGIKLYNTYLNFDTASYAKSSVNFNYTENYLTFEFAGIDYTNPFRIKYQYKMEGLDTGWTDCENRTQASFTNLDPGNYIFRVKCLNSFGISNSNECFIYITITPPFWRTWWFYILATISTLGSIYLFIKFRERSLQKEKIKLESIVTERTAEVISQKEIIELKNKEVTDSIYYAKKIQQAILPSKELFQQLLGNCFILFKPKDIVSGDFFWIKETEQYIFDAKGDCTGHGVPGGFMCMLGSSLLNEIVDEDMLEPAEILNQMRDKIILSLKQTGNSGENKDGMDMLLCRLSKDKSTLTYAAANNSMYLIHNNELVEYKANKMPIGFHTGNQENFTQHSIGLKKGDVIYSFTDGYADQFGGPKGKKFKYSQFESLLLSIHQKNIQEQNTLLNEGFENWRGDLEQLDDVLVIGLSI